MKNRIRLDVASSVAVITLSYLISNLFFTIAAFFVVFAMTKARWDERDDDPAPFALRPAFTKQVHVFAVIWFAGLLTGVLLQLAYYLFTPGDGRTIQASALVLVAAGFVMYKLSAYASKYAQQAWKLDVLVK